MAADRNSRQNDVWHAGIVEQRMALTITQKGRTQTTS
jgi:hypothetical protein